MKKIIKTLFTCMIVLMLASSISQTANADILGFGTYKNFHYGIWSENEVYIYEYTGKKTKIVIPKTIKGKKVVGVGALDGNIEEMHFPNGVPISASSQSKLKKVTINKTNDEYMIKNNLVLSKDGTILESCPGSIKNPKIPNSVEIIGSNAFGANITTLKLGKNVKVMESGALSGNDKLKKITFNKKLKTIETNAFAWCTALKKVSLPQGLETIGSRAFGHCTSLKKVTIPNTVKTIENGAFEHCTSLKTITIPSTVKTIGESAFLECDKLKSIYIYNKNCKIKRGYSKYYITIPKTTTIYGYKGSTAEKYAKRFGNPFVEIKK